ncbi:TPA: hypothetical protein NKP42_002326 [Vibrio parahaemolyticus]|uniref:hypothetical protein n=1 Tax=Vibrio parahaemolyticus TaxID=670 RepID=UPI001121D384|nr:hypothetical protein [Vibrio parahaemolyticus]MDF4266083.1 hypothetical protein [Vibrio parahaemolyticus]MDF4271519.1 hypothetical protein [Vibrio parahaemolyticus]MDF4296077.1 hypothetical protein [Vibrio parahaemolyticus]TOG87956.1 hypothetical protein CGI91_18845 [Vibrio parahaemolyticus]TOO92286.1 hypothetical protein CGH25_21625 [Vibrio parahaemolyticus]
MDVNAIKRIIFRLFPELTGRWHLPRWGKVVALPELPEEGDMSDRFYPHYAVDVQLLDEKGVEFKDKSPLQAVPLPIPGVGEYAGRLEPPAIGSIVEIGFMFGQPDKPFIRCVLPLGFKLPAIKQGESRYQKRQGVYQLVDEAGNFESKTDKDNITECLNQRIKVLEDKIEEITNNKTTTAKQIIEVADLITMNGGKGVVQGDCICAYTGKPHSDLSSTVKAGK